MEQEHDTEPRIVIDIEPFDGIYPDVNVTADTIFSKVDIQPAADDIASDDEIESVF